MKKKGILLYSGGLDSLLAAKILLDQGIEVIGLNFILPFADPINDPLESRENQLAKSVGLNVRFIHLGDEYMNIVANPPHGHGQRMNPCIDCKIFFLREAARIMREEGAAFVATGEVVGQRPMSQKRHMLKHIEKEAELEGFLLRPLSAKLLEPTIAEQQGVVDREKLYDVSGRQRNRQIAMAHEFGINDFNTPAGGCLLTDPSLSLRVRDLIELMPVHKSADLYLLQVGRHFRYSPEVKIIVARNEKECTIMERHKSACEYFLEPVFAGPTALVCGKSDEKILQLTADIIGRYGKIEDDGEVRVVSRDGRESVIHVSGAPDQEFLNRIII